MRLAPERVVEAYQKCGMKPRKGLYYLRNQDGTECCCGLTAVALAGGNFYSDLDELTTIDLSEHLGLDMHYACGFTIGFDTDGEFDSDPHYGPKTLEGVEDGKAAWTALVNAGLAQ